MDEYFIFANMLMSLTRPFLLCCWFAAATILPAQNWQTLPNAPAGLTFPVVVELDGNIHVIGGGATGGATDLHLRFTPGTGKWDTLAPVPYKAQQPAGAVVNGKIHFCGGGYPNSGSRLSKHYVYDPDSAKWFKAADMPVATAIHKAVGFRGRLYCFGGQPDKTLSEYYDPANDQWLQLSALPDQNFWYGAIVSTGSSIYRFGGGGYSVPTDACHKYDSAADKWVSIAKLPIMPLHAPGVASIGDSLICISAGYSNLKDQVGVLLYDIAKNTYFTTRPMPSARSYHSMVYSGNCLYSVGGNNNDIPEMSVSVVKYCDPAKSWPAGIEHLSTDQPWHVFSNGNYIQIQGDNAFDGPLNLAVYDMGGRLLLSNEMHVERGSISLPCDHLPVGMYILKMQGINHSQTERLFINR